MTSSHVLVPLDGSPLADEALKHALAVFDCRMTVLNVVTPLDSTMSEGGVLEPDKKRLMDAREQANRRIERASTSIEHAGTRTDSDGRTVETAVETGNPAKTILRYVESHDVDHVVMGGHGGETGHLTKRLLGAVSTVVVSEAPVSVTVVR